MATIAQELPDKPLVLQAVTGDDPEALGLTYSALDFRNLLGAIWPRVGPVGVLGFRVYQAAGGPGWSIDVNKGFAVLGDQVSSFDRYLGYNATRLNIPLTSFMSGPPGTRVHRVFLGVYDKEMLGSEYATKIIVTEDTGTGAPAPGPGIGEIPTYYIELATVTVPSGGTTVTDSMISNIAPHAGMGFGVHSLPLASGFISGDMASGGGDPKYYASSGGTVKLMGTVAKSSGNFLNSVAGGASSSGTYVIGTLPVEYRPKVTRNMASTGAGGYAVRVTVGTNGNVSVNWQSSTDLTFICLDGCEYELE